MKGNPINRIRYLSIKSIIVLSCILLPIYTFISFIRAGVNISVDTYRPSVLILGSLVYIVLLVGVRAWIYRRTNRQMDMLGIILLTSFAVGLLYVGLTLRSIPPMDLKHLHIEAVNMLETGKITNTGYFEVYPFQQNATIILYAVFNVFSLFGGNDFRLCGVLFNVSMIWISAFFLYRIMLEEKGKPSAVFTLFVLVTMPNLYLYAAYYYTDTISLPFMLIGIWAILRGMRSEKRKQKYAWTFLAGISLFIGAKLRTTVIFVLIAAVIVYWIKQNWKECISLFLSLILGTVVSGIIWLPIFSTYCADLNPEKEYPVTHWMMMGLNEDSNSGWNSIDFDFTKNQPSYAGKISGNLDVIQTRLQDIGMSGLSRLFSKKIGRVWGDGTNRYETYLDASESYHRLYEYVRGEKSIFIKYVMQFMRCAVFLLMTVGAVKMLLRQNHSSYNLLLSLIMLAAFAFYLIWEAHGKYSLSFIPIMLLLAEPGTETLLSVRDYQGLTLRFSSGEYQLSRQKLFRFLRGIWMAVICCTFLTGLVGQHYYTGIVKERSEVRVNQKTNYWGARIQNVGVDGITQSFAPENSFNQVAVHFRNPDKIQGNEYLFRILDSSGVLLEEQPFASESVKDNQYKYFRFDTISCGKEDVFYLQIAAREEYKNSIVINAAYEKPSEFYTTTYDFYPGGEVVTEGFPSGTDLCFLVRYLSERPLVSLRVYLVLCSAQFFWSCWHCTH